MENMPFSQHIVSDKMVRVFTPSVDSEELKWHQDLKDREVKIVESGNWQFQIENELPIKLFDGQILNIQKYSWHRVIKGDGNLIVEIKED